MISINIITVVFINSLVMCEVMSKPLDVVSVP